MRDVDQNKLDMLVRWKRPVHTETTTNIANVVADILKSIEPARKKYGSLAQSWQQILPAGLAQHCKIESVKNGLLNILTENVVYASEIRLCEKELIAELNKLCPKAKITKIRSRIDHR